MDEPDYIRAHKHSARHRDEILASERCGCFFCLAVFAPGEIDGWITEKPDRDHWIKDDAFTAICPKCRIDSVIGDASGFPITSSFLNRMKEYWFSDV